MKCRNILTALTALAVPCCLAAENQFTVDFSKSVGEVKRINGICNSTPIANSRKGDLREKLKALEPPCLRFHDAALENPGYALIDVSRVFPLFHADADDPRNYCFDATDDYLELARHSGAELEYRLGETIEHSFNTYRVKPPEDFAKWAEICAHIVKHYNEGWGKNGKHWNIRRWTIWEEPNTVPQLWDPGTKDRKEAFRRYCELYRTTALRLKKEFKDIEVGGPVTGGYWEVLDFIEYCAGEKLPIDFACWTGYVRNPSDYFEWAVKVRECLDRHGYRNTKTSMGEWHLAPVSWTGHAASDRPPRFAELWNRQLTSPASGVFTLATLVKMQDSPIDMMFFYAFRTGSWGLIDRIGQPTPSYWGMKAFADAIHGGRERVAAPTEPAPGWYLLATKEKESGRGHVLLAAYRVDNCSGWSGGPQKLVLLGGHKPVKVRCFNDGDDYVEVREWEWHPETNELWLYRLLGDSAFWHVETEPVK